MIEGAFIFWPNPPCNSVTLRTLIDAVPMSARVRMVPKPDMAAAPASPAAAMMPAERRRARLAVRPNPAERLTYQVSLRAGADQSGALFAWILVDYVPDRMLLDPAAFASYVALVSQQAWEGLEALGVAVLDDLNNELVPRWVRVTLRAAQSAQASSLRHEVMLEDWQPSWTGTPEAAAPPPASPASSTRDGKR